MSTGTSTSDPRPGLDEGREQAHVNRAGPVVADLHFDDLCTLCTVAALRLAKTVEVLAAGDVALAIRCDHGAEPPR
ncbi:hypothetical protein Q7689_03660 [Nocardiopsis tropica]|uniref:hypothetical protein n=1 Tax=Nocardiopsis tropica TaxID=109330 RepID=UPI002E83579D|nr:hypothetical protein [Nocardiopsis tropica]